MWIMLITKLPTRPSPPKMSIFWSTPWPNEQFARSQGIRAAGLSEYSRKGRGYSPRKFDENDWAKVDSAISVDERMVASEIWGMVASEIWGMEPNWKGARRIHFASKDLRVFPHEFSVLKPENMQLYVCGDDNQEASHILVPEGAASEELIDAVLNGEQRFLYDAALLDGCTHEKAIATAMGRNITIPDAQFPPVGWYRAKDFVMDMFCRDHEKLEHREDEKELISEEA